MILVRLSPLQRALYTEFMNRFREAGNTGWLSLNPLKAFCVCCKVSTAAARPSSLVFTHFLRVTAYPFRSGTTRTSFMRPCRRKICQTNKIWTLTTSPQQEIHDAPLPPIKRRRTPTIQTPSGDPVSASCRRKPTKLSLTNGYGSASDDSCANLESMLTKSNTTPVQANEIMCDYKPGILENSAKMVLLFHLIEESVRKGDKILVFR